MRFIDLGGFHKSGNMDKAEKFSLIKEKINSCNKCPDLVQSRIKTVPGQGNINTRLVILGESPGNQENCEGIPFVGRSGKLLNNILNTVKIKREDVFILNTVACHPENNRNPTDIELNNCRGFLELQINLVNPNYIICLGAIAAKTILNTELSIAKLRGNWYDWKDKKVIVTYHPSWCLQGSDEQFLERKQKIIEDFLFLIKGDTYG